MFSKLGRGGGRGGGKRPFPPPPPSGLHRHAAPGGARLPIGGAVRNNRPRGGPLPPAAPPAREESFSLAPGDPDFAAIIRLTPDIFDEIRRLEAQGGAARIKFASNANNLPDNVIDVGGKEFNFTWAQELGVCDIYEECQSGENGHGLLTECGSAWRKLNVQRILDESTKNHVKKRSEEAERRMKSRKAIILDSANPSVKNQVKSMTAAGVDGSNRRMNWTRKEPPKKRKVESSQAPFSGPPKLTSRSGVSSKITTKAKLSLSPSSSPHGQPEPATSASTFGIGNSSNPKDINDPLNINKEDVDNLEKERPTNVVHGATHETIGHKWATDDQQMDLRSILIMLLSQNTKGMTLKALEKSVGEAIPNSGKKIESVIKNIATYQTPGRYFLKPGVELETSKRRVSESGSSPAIARNHTSASESVLLETDTSGKNKQRSAMNSKVDDESEPFEKFDLKRDGPTPYTTEKIINNDNEGKPCSSSVSGTDSESESDSSDSGSDSESQSRGRSKSRSSSDSESDGSSSDKEGSDEEVQITMSDDEAEHKNEATELKIRPSPRTCTASDDEHEQIDIVGNDEGQNASPHIDLNDSGRDRDILNALDVTEKFPISNNVEASEKYKSEVTKSVELDPYQTNSTFADKRMSLSPDKWNHSEAERNVKKISNDTIKQGINQSINEKHTMMDRYINEQSEVSERILKSKSKRAPDSENIRAKPESTKRSKTTSLPQAMSSAKSNNATSPENSNYISPDRPKHDLYKDQMVQNLAEHGRLGASNYRNSSMLDTEHSGLRTSDPNGRMKMLDNMEKNSRYVENLGRSNQHTEGLSFHPNNMPMQEKHSLLKDNSCKDMPDANGDTSEKYPVKNVRENFPVDKLSSTPDSYKRECAENYGISKDNWGLSHLQKSGMVNSIVSGKGGVLRRELSDLELGEFREPSSGEETGRVGRQFDRKGSMKSLEITADNSNIDTSRTVGNALSESKKQSSASLKTGIQGNQDGFKRRVMVDDVMDSTRPQQRTVPAQIQQFSRVDHTDTDNMVHSDKPAEVAVKNDTRAQGMGLENHMGGHQKATDGMLPQDANKHNGRMSSKTVKESKPQRPNASKNSIDRSNNSFLMENDNNDRKRRESSSDDDNSFYSKYDKDKPELKGVIKDFSQYKEYVQQYREKYGHYCSLHKNLKNTQNEFLKVGIDLQAAKERDMEEYYIIVEDLKEMYHQHGVRHKQMKKIFILLHEELKNLKQRIQDFVQTYAKD